jgi:hypothetical protein
MGVVLDLFDVYTQQNYKRNMQQFQGFDLQFHKFIRS